MELEDFFGQSFSCGCGKTHRVDPLKFVYASDAISQLPTVCKDLDLGPYVALLMDTRTRKVAGGEVAEAISGAGWRVEEVLVKDRDRGQPVCDDITKNELEGRIGAVDWIFVVGSGVLNDLGKWVAAERKIPYICFATAASMNGYVSANVAPAVKGVKTLVLAQPPRAIITDPRVLADAPYPLTSAGLGDLLAKGVSITDWYLNYLLFGDYYCERSANMIADMERLYLNQPEGLPLKIPEAMEGLFKALILSGVSMNMVGTSLPASGGEHLISHTLDLLSSIERCEHDLHGRQVGVATVLTAELYRRVLSMESPTLSEPHEIRQNTLWGPYADTVKRSYAQKVSRLQEAREKLLRKNGWDQLREGLLSRLDPPERIHGCLRSAAGASRAEDILCSRDRLSLAFRHAHEIRSHFTILDLAYLVGLMPGAANEIVEAWA